MRNARIRRDLWFATTLAFLLALGVIAASPAAAPNRRPTVVLSADHVPAQGPVTVTGRAPRGTRTVAVQLRRAGRWETVRARKVPASGRYRLPAPTSWWGRREVRVAAHAGRRTTYSRTVAYTVTPGFRPLGRPGHHRLRDAGYRWDPCRTIRWKYNPRGRSAEVLPDVKEAFRVITGATGLRFRYAGLTRKVALRDAPSSAGADILVSWSNPDLLPVLHGRKVGLALAAGDATRRWYSSGAIALDNTHRLRTGADTSGAPTWGQVVLHEIAHVIGLGHVDRPAQLMFETLQSSNHRLGAGDLAGLRALGADHPCR